MMNEEILNQRTLNIFCVLDVFLLYDMVQRRIFRINLSIIWNKIGNHFLLQ
jgi:hypothetical protein